MSLATTYDATTLLVIGDTGIEPVDRASKARMLPLHQSPATDVSDTNVLDILKCFDFTQDS